MNRLAYLEAPSRFVDEPHGQLALDGVPLDALLDAAAPGRGLLGLVPALLPWMLVNAEAAEVWHRILPPDDERTNAPVLMCPDDLDFSCTLVVAEVVTGPATVQWPRLGIDMTRDRDPHRVATMVDWLPDIGPFEFSRAEYSACVRRFARQPAP